MEIKIEKKFSERQIDQFIHSVYNNYKLHPIDKYVFDLTETEWISNQGLLLFTGLLKYFIVKKINFEVLFVRPTTSIKDIPKRVALQIVQIWETWGIWKIIPDYQYRKYLGIDYNTVKSLKKQYGIKFTRPEIYDDYEITPFVVLDNIQNYDDSIIINSLNEYHRLNEATEQIVKENLCAHPFVNELFGEIISREIYENFLNHYETSFFDTPQDFSFFSLSLKGKIKEDFNSKIEIQEKLELNFNTEELPQTEEFFINQETKEFKNQSYISYSFFDFGKGIANTLKEEFNKNNESTSNDIDEEIIKYAFRHDTSRHPIRNVFNNVHIKDYIPRGLFDVLCLVQRYNGLLIVRSNFGKVLYNFSETSDIEKAFTPFGDNKLYFPGTFITLYLPAIDNGKKIDQSVIKPIFNIPNYSKSTTSYVSLFKLIENVKYENGIDVYSKLFDELYNVFKIAKNKLTYFSLENISDKQLIKKIIFFFVANYEINLYNNVVVFHPPKKELLNEINHEILSLSNVNLNYKIHPLPFVYYDPIDAKIEIYWLGIYDEKDKKTLDGILFERFSLAKSDFNDPDSIIGHLNYFDKNNNLESNFPNRTEIIEFYRKGELFSRISEIDSLIRSECISKHVDSIYLCSGNYYQIEYLELINLLNDRKKCLSISTTLYNILIRNLDILKLENRKYKFISFTSSSHRILTILEEEGIVNQEDMILVDNYHDLDTLRDKLPNSIIDFDFILICDAISTGFLVNRVDGLLKANCLKFIAVIADTIDPAFSLSKEFYEMYEKKIISLVKYPIKKFQRNSEVVKKYLAKERIIRINPYTNIPIRLGFDETNPSNIVLTKNEFLEIIDEKHILIGNLKFNNILHPYFFNTYNIIKNVGLILLDRIFNKVNSEGQNIVTLETKNLKIFYPKDSDVKQLNFLSLKNDVLKDHSITHYELERYIEEDGWKFPHTTKYIGEIVNNNPVLILDDGTCTGDSLTQMINELSFYNPQKITVLSIIGRLPEHKREFLSTIERIRKGNREIQVEVFFGTHWHVPTFYLNDNPNTIERNRLVEIVSIYNSPSRIKKFASSINKSLVPKKKESFKNHRFLPKDKQTSLIPCKDIIDVRDEVGKVIGFRFYKENFDWFNSFIKKYESSEKKDRYKEIELLCATISFEPYIYNRLRKILPDVTDKLCEFIDSIIFGNPKKNNKQLNLVDLTYDWDSKDIIHLFFILYPNDELIHKLKENNNISKLLHFFEVQEITIDYLFYKFLNYFPLNNFEIEKKNPAKILALLKTLAQNPSLNDEYLRQLNIFKAFISSLPSKKDYSQQLFSISDSLENLLKDEYHKTSFRAQLGYMLSDIESMKIDFHAVNVKQFNDNWINISKFIAEILSFTKSYPSYLPLKAYNEAQTVTIVYGRLNELVPNLNENSNFNEIDGYLEKLRSSIFNSNSEIFKLFLKPITYNIVSDIESKIKDFAMEDKCLVQDNLLLGSKLVFPEFYFKEIVLESILNNLRHRDIAKDPVLIKVNESSANRYIEISIENVVSIDYKPGTGYGSILLDHANSFPRNAFQYSSIRLGRTYYQKIIIKKL